MTVKPAWARKSGRRRRREADTAPAGTAPAETTRSPWALSAADWRLLVITFVGGLGSIVAGAGIIGGAIAIARNATGGQGSWFLFTAVSVVLFVVMVRFFGPALWGVDHVSALVRLFVVVVAWIFVVASGVFIALGLLVLIGRAAGIK